MKNATNFATTTITASPSLASSGISCDGRKYQQTIILN